MLFLSLVFSITIFAQTDMQKVDKTVQSYFSQLHAEKIDEALLEQSFVSTYTMDKTLFVKCKKNECKVETQIIKNPKKENLYRVNVKVTYKEKKKTVEIQSRKGCYFVENLKMKSYMEDCDGK